MIELTIIIFGLLGYIIFKDIQHTKQISMLKFSGGIESPIEKEEVELEKAEDLDNYVPLNETDAEQLLKALQKEEVEEIQNDKDI